MTKLEELKAAHDAAYAAVHAAIDAAAIDAACDAWGAYKAELKKTQEENSNAYDQVQEGDGSTV
jgi:hypothetical protein